MEIVEQVFLLLAYIAVIGFFISGLDDLFFDVQFLIYLWRNRERPNIKLQDLKLAPEQWIAVLVPAWQEGGIVNKMAEYAARVLIYEKYDIFIGVYPNDPETNDSVDKICAENPRIHKVLVPHPGPTNKADCLNWTYRAMRLNEVPGTREYKLVAIHDAEDVLHPLVLKVYNYFVPREYDMAQVPVFALELPVLTYWTGNTYIDDFAELHTKDQFARENIGGVVPSAGVGTAFLRASLDKLASENGGDPFHTNNLTEDYEIGIRLKRAGFRTGMVSYPVDRIVRRKRRDGTFGPPETITEVVAVRENFPSTFRAAVRQRTRWILGISFQTWEQAGWAGTLPMRYTLLRDRRAPLTHLINIVGYVVLAYVLFQWAFLHSAWASTFYFHPLFVSESLLWKITIIDTCLLAYRSVQKFISVYSIYNWKQALFSIPRVVINNFINFTSTVRAAKAFLVYKITGRQLVWQKTSHVFPGEAELREFKKSIEDLLVEEGLVTRQQIFQALKVEKVGSAPLALLRLGLLDEKQFTDIWAKHSGLGVRLINPLEIPEEWLKKFSEKQSLECEAIPASKKNGHLTVAFREPPVNGQLERLRKLLDIVVHPVLARPSNIAYARDRAYPRLVLPPSRLAEYAERFRQAANLDTKAFLDLLSTQHATRRSLPDVLCDKGLLREPEARRLWADSMGLPPASLKDAALDRELYTKIGPTFWWLHRMLPLKGSTVVTAAPPHPLMVESLAPKLGGRTAFVGDLPGRVEAVARTFDVEIDPDQMLIERLLAKGFLKRENLPDMKALRSLIADPLPKWLLLQKLVTEEQLHTTFLEIANLPLAGAWKPEEARRLMPVLPPGFSADTGCYCLEQAKGAIRLGLSQMPSAKSLREIYDRLAGYPIFFQAVSFADAIKLRRL